MINTLQTDANFPRFATSGDMADLAQEESMFRDAEVAEDVAGYICTPLARAYDLFEHLLGMQLLDARRFDRQ